MLTKPVVILKNEEGQKMIKEMCKKHGVIYSEFEGLIEAQVGNSDKERRRRLWDNFDDILDRIMDGE